MYFLELSVTFLAFINIFLTIKQKIIRWPLDSFIILMTLYINHSLKLYDRWLLTIFILINNFYGWYQWKYGGKNNLNRRVNYISLKKFILIIFTGFIISYFLYFFLKIINSDLPILSSIKTTFSCIAMVMSSHKNIRNWILWIFINIISVYIYISKERYIFGLKYSYYAIMALFGYICWRREYKKFKKIKKNEDFIKQSKIPK